MSGTAPSDPAPWFEARRDRLEWELEQFSALGLEVSQAVEGAERRLLLRTALTHRGAPVAVTVKFPYEYPDEPPEVYGPSGVLDRHQEPTTGLFCWSEDPDREWSTGMAAAALVRTVQTLLEDSEAGRLTVRAFEADMPEPVSGYAVSSPRVVLVPDPFFERDLSAGSGAMRLLDDRGTLMLVEADGLGASDPAVVQRVMSGGRHEPTGYWVAPEPTPTAPAFNGTELEDILRAAAPGMFSKMQSRFERKRRLQSAEMWLGMTFMEEGPTRGAFRRNWLFSKVQLNRDGSFHPGRMLGAQAVTLVERQRRTPELVGLADARVLVVGAGSLGAPLTFELAKAGVGHQDVVDYDDYDVNNGVRHILEPRYAGLPKAPATARRAAGMNPFVAVKAHEFRVGRGPSEAARLRGLISAADVVVDTTGANSVGRVLQRYCSEAATPLVVAGLSAGSYGADILICRPGEACLECFLLAQRDQDIPSPPAAPRTSLVTPVGCSHPAFAGAGFDASELAAVVARVVVQATGRSKYPAADFDWAVMNFRSAPRWRSGRLQRRGDCSRHE